MPRPASPATTTAPLVLPREVRKRPLLLLVDGYSLVFRSYFALTAMGTDMRAPDGLPTNALYSFTTMLLNAVERFDPNQFLVAIDAHGPSFRDAIYADYKGNREDAPEDLKIQLDVLREYLTGTELPWLEKEGFEADDILGTLATQGEAAGFDVAIITGDRDVLQLVSERVTVYMTKIGTSDMQAFDPAALQEKYGVPPEQFVEYKALLGDKSDNIPGVPGIGEKTAVMLLAQFPDIESLIAHAEEVQPKGARAKLTEYAAQARLSRELSEIRRDVQLDWSLTGRAEFTFERGRFKSWFHRFGFRTLAKRYGVDGESSDAAASPTPVSTTSAAPITSAPTVAPSAIDVDVVIVQSMADAEALMQQLRKAKRFAFDFETDSLNTRTTNLVGLAFSYEAERGYYLPVGHYPEADLLTSTASSDLHENLPLDAVLALVKPLFEDAAVLKVVQNGKFEHAVCCRYDIALAGMDFDTFVASYLLNPDMRHGLKDMAETHLGLVWNKIEDLIGSGKKQVSMSTVPISLVGPYAVYDAVATWRLYELFAPQLEQAGLRPLFDEIEVPLVPVLADMESTGIRVDPTVLERLGLQLQNRLGELEQAAVEATGGRGLNLSSPKQLSEYFFQELKLPNPKKGSTDIEVLEELLGLHPLIEIVIEYRELTKLRGTYIQGLLPLIAEDGRIHTSYNQGVAATGRLSSANPNLQNIPIRTELGRSIRKAFVPRNAEFVLLSGDYSQIELRLLAHYSKDEALMEVYHSGGDIHTETAVSVLGMDPAHPDPEKRRQAKAINFGIIYGMGAYSLSRSLGISQKEAQEFINGYFERFARVRGFFDRILQEGRDRGYVETFLGRRRYFPELTSGNGMRRAMAERAAMNMPLQGGASDLIKLAMVQLDPAVRQLGAYMLLQVHDELVFEVPLAQLEESIGVIGPMMAKAYQFEVPIQVELKTGPSWYDMESAGSAT